MTHDTSLGRAEYERLCGVIGIAPRDLPPVDRPTHLPHWLTLQLAATEAARVRLQRWWTGAQPDAEPEHVAFAGDQEIRGAVVRVLGHVPRCVRHHIVTSVLVVGVGTSSRAWQQTGPVLPIPQDEPLGLVCINGHGLEDLDLLGVIAHEFAHGWLVSSGTPTDPSRHVELEEIRRLHVSLADSLGRLPELYQEPMRRERQACGLAGSWGFTGFATDGATQARLARRRVDDEAARVPLAVGLAPSREAAS